eukprot:3883402-Amphidinium_carterae.2
MGLDNLRETCAPWRADWGRLHHVAEAMGCSTDLQPLIRLLRRCHRTKLAGLCSPQIVPSANVANEAQPLSCDEASLNLNVGEVEVRGVRVRLPSAAQLAPIQPAKQRFERVGADSMAQPRSVAIQSWCVVRLIHRHRSAQGSEPTVVTISDVWVEVPLV